MFSDTIEGLATALIVVPITLFLLRVILEKIDDFSDWWDSLPRSRRPKD